MYALDNCFTSLSISDINSLSYFVCFVSSVDVWGRDGRRKEPRDRSFLYKLETGKFPTISYLSLSVLVLESDNRKGFLADCRQLLCVSLKVSLQHVLTLLTAICFYPHTDMAFPSLWKESQVLGMDWWMKVMVNGSVNVDVTTQYLNVIKFITI